MRTRFQRILSVLVGVILVLTGVFLSSSRFAMPDTFADESGMTAVSDIHHVVIYDGENKLSVKTDAVTVGEVLERAKIIINDSDIVDPKLDTIINSDNFYINIYRAHPVIIIDGSTSKYLMTASYDPATIAREAGLTVYDGDEIQLMADSNFLEVGATATYKITRNGGRTITIEESIPFSEEIKYDASLAKNETRVDQIGEDGRKVVKYQVNFVDGVEISRELVSEEVVLEPVAKITVYGAKSSISPEQETCANWARQAGVSEVDLSAAIYLIYHESGCRVDASNSHSGAYGIPQALPGSKMASAGADWATNPVTQIKWMAGYVSRYGGWQGAYSFWLSHHWY